jgi:serine/threonine-protein phosphatase 2A catalytic subunit
MPEQHLIPQPPLEPTTIPILDSWIAGLLSCKQLAENDVQRLCEKVCLVYQARQLLMG